MDAILIPYVTQFPFWSLVVLGVLIIVVTQFALLVGLTHLAKAAELPIALQGILLGFATSAPELAGTVATAWQGYLGAGLWNVASSNIINTVLFVTAGLFYKRLGAMKHPELRDELQFALLSLLIPVLLGVATLSTMRDGHSSWVYSWPLAVGLLLFFVWWVWAHLLAVKEAIQTTPLRGKERPEGLRRGVFLFLLGVGLIIYLGKYLGIAAEASIADLGVSEWGVGWILGFLTSLPELTTFFAVFGSRKLTDHEAAEESVDNLVASNMSNATLIYPIGIIIFLYVS
jgi:cation:H+ antiporter